MLLWMHKYVTQNPSHIVRKIVTCTGQQQAVCFSLRLESAEKKCHVEHYTVFSLDNSMCELFHYYVTASLYTRFQESNFMCTVFKHT